MNDPLTKADLIEVMDIYIKPFYELAGALIAGVVILAVFLVVFNGVHRLWKQLI